MSSQFKSSSTLATLQPSTTKSVTFATSTSTESNPTEEKWWVTQFGLGSPWNFKKKKNKSLRPKKIQFPSPSNAIVSNIQFSHRGPPHQIAIVSGPRVCLYGGSTSSSLSLSLANVHKKKSLLYEEDDDDEEEEDVAVSVKADRNIGTGGQPAHCMSYRTDGRLVAIGTDDGYVKVCDATSRATLRTFGGASGGSGSNYAVRSVSWLKGGKKIISAGDDGLIRLWDLSAGIGGGGLDSDKKAVDSMVGHGDSVRSCLVFSIKREENEDSSKKGKWKEIVVSGSYDHTIRVWDLESEEEDKCLAVMNHGAPVEALLVLPSKTKSSSSSTTPPLVVSAGGTTLKLWNPLTGKCISTVQTKHSKTITSLTLAKITKESNGIKREHTRIITGGLDGLIRIHSADAITEATATEKKKKEIIDLPYLHGVKINQPITSLGMSPDQTRFVVGTSTGLILVRQRASSSTLDKKRKRKEQPGTYSYFTRGANVGPPVQEEENVVGEDLFMVMQNRREKLTAYDSYLRGFEYGKALDVALETKDHQAVAAVLEELGRRKGLIIALSNRDEETLEPILSFTVRYIIKPRYTPLLVGVANLLCDIYSPIMGQSESIDELFERLRRAVLLECKSQKTLLRIVGQIDAIVWSAEMQRFAAGGGELEEEE